MNKSQLNDARRLARLEDIEQIRTLKARYAEALDNRFNGEEISALFTEGGTWRIGENEALIQGRIAIKEHCLNLAENISWSKHYFTPSVIEVDNDGLNAAADFYLLDLQTMKNQNGEDEAYLFAGKLKDRLKKVDGHWFFDHIYGIIDLVTPWSESWVKKSFIPNFFAGK